VGKEGSTAQDQFSKYLIDATVAATDPGIWKHPGFTLNGTGSGTHPTLAQRLVSDLILIDEPASLQRNIRERLLAAQVTTEFGREKILEWYLNSASYGDLIYGADAASRAYFGKSASELSLAEAAMLVAISNAPATNPLSGSQVHKQQQERVVLAMLDNGFISTSDAQQAFSENLQFQADKESNSITPAFVDLVMEQLSTQMSLERIRRGGFDIVTTLDYGLQMQAKCATEIQIDRIQETQNYSNNMDVGDCQAAKLLPNLQKRLEEPIGNIHVDVVILDPHSGQILTFVRDESTEIDTTNTTTHPAGTILSPFLYLTAFTRGMNPATLLWDIPSNNGLIDEEADQTEVAQGQSTSFHGPIRARIALVNDYLAAATEVLQQVRVENVLLTENRFGITNSESQKSSVLTIEDLFSREITFLDVAKAYGVLANQGVMAGQANIGATNEIDPDGLNPTIILQVLSRDGKLWLNWSDAQAKSIISPQLSYLATHVLSDEFARWPSLGHPNSLEIGRSAAAKVGLTSMGNDAWVVGYIPQLVVGIWLGHLQEETGDISWEMPAGLWHAITKYASSELPVQEFTHPDGISLVQVCDPSGLLVSELCPSIVQEAFLAGNEPTQVDNLYQKYSVNRDTGSLATIFTPLDMVEEKVYLMVPPYAVTWARNSGFPIPPDTYDVIYASEPKSPTVRITSPEALDHVSEQVRFMGSAAGPAFSYYRLQVGKGLNPREWIQIGKDSYDPVVDGTLGTWDTVGLEGLYVVQLQVVRQDQRIDRDLLQITIDNTPPQVHILTPTEGAKITFQPEESIIMQVLVNDNLMLERVDFLINGEHQITLYQPPFIIIWRQELGDHNLLVRAYDLAGNNRESVLSFSVKK
jgi:membrane peptidoglycan carboxypeptidase